MARLRFADASDELVVEAARGGDRDAVETLLTRHFDLVHAVCRRVLWRREHADALEQARQDALLRIARGLPGFKSDAKVTSWIHRIATNAALDALHRYQRTPVPAVIADTGRVTAAPDDAVTTRAHIDACLDELPDTFREPVVLCFLCDLDYAEIATELALPVGTVKSRIHRARAALKECLGTSLLTAESNGW